MKRLTALLLIFSLAAALCSCGGGKPDEMSDAMYQIGKNALGVADQYIAGEITGDDAYDRLEEFYEQAEAQVEYDKEITGSETLAGTEYWRDWLVSTDIMSVMHDVGFAKYGNKAMSEVQESRDSLAETLGK